MARLTNPIQFYNDEKGRTLKNAKLYFYDSGTFDVKDTYSDAALTSVNPNPVVADGAGRFPNIFMGTGSYRLVLEDEDGVEIATKDDVANIIGDGEDISTALNVTTATDTQTVTGALDSRVVNRETIADLRTTEPLIAKQQANVAYHTTAASGGGGLFWYDDSDSTTADNGGTVIVTSGGARWKRSDQENLTVLDYGALLDGTDSVAACNAMLSDKGYITLPDAAEGELYTTVINDLSTINGGDTIRIRGQGRDRTTLLVTIETSEILLDNFRLWFYLTGMTVKNVETDLTTVKRDGQLLDSAASGSAFYFLDDLRTIGFDAVGKIRQSTWGSFGDVECTDYGTSPIDFTRFLKDGSPPSSGWNIFPNGWYNNAINIRNYLTRNGPDGPTFSGGSIEIGTLTCEGLTGNGLIVEGAGSSDKCRPVTVQNLYTENIDASSIRAIDVQDLVIDTWFLQGQTMGDPSIRAIDQNEAKVTVRHVVGQDWFITGAKLRNNSELYGEVAGAVTGSRYDLDATSLHVDLFENPNFKKWTSGTLSDTQSITLTDAIADTDSNYEMIIGVIYDGSPFEVQHWTIWRPASGSAQIQQTTNGANRVVTVTQSGDDLVVTNDQGALTMVFTITVVNHSAMSIDGS